MASPTASARLISCLLRPLLPLPMLSTLLLHHHLAAAASSTTRSPLRVVAAMSSSAAGGTSSAHGGGRNPNRLAAEHNPYLLQHAHNPVDCYPWGDEAFEKAREKDVPIFLSNDKYGRPGFKTVLRRIKEAWETKRDVLEQTGNVVIKQLRDALENSTVSSS